MDIGRGARARQARGAPFRPKKPQAGAGLHGSRTARRFRVTDNDRVNPAVFARGGYNKMAGHRPSRPKTETWYAVRARAPAAISDRTEGAAVCGRPTARSSASPRNSVAKGDADHGMARPVGSRGKVTNEVRKCTFVARPTRQNPSVHVSGAKLKERSRSTERASRTFLSAWTYTPGRPDRVYPRIITRDSCGGGGSPCDGRVTETFPSSKGNRDSGLDTSAQSIGFRNTRDLPSVDASSRRLTAGGLGGIRTSIQLNVYQGSAS